ncbi:MAG: hypothetical protein HXK66_01945 [Clostridiales bacterium]|nr:hypothetical protein [Clostridiales bacterium]MBF0978914.1 hypothetical protein [Clostridiales bacterium]
MDTMLKLKQEALDKVERNINELEGQLDLLNEGEDYNRLKNAIRKLNDIRTKVINNDDIIIQIVLDEL